MKATWVKAGPLGVQEPVQGGVDSGRLGRHRPHSPTGPELAVAGLTRYRYPSADSDELQSLQSSLRLSIGDGAGASRTAEATGLSARAWKLAAPVAGAAPPRAAATSCGARLPCAVPNAPAPARPGTRLQPDRTAQVVPVADPRDRRPGTPQCACPGADKRRRGVGERPGSSSPDWRRCSPAARRERVTAKHIGYSLNPRRAVRQASSQEPNHLT
jgi:hypothetical protein